MAPCVIVYCHSLDMCVDLYAHFHYELGNNSYYPPGADATSDNHLLGMFHANTHQHKLKSLTKPDGEVRVVFATIALGMGVNKVQMAVHKVWQFTKYGWLLPGEWERWQVWLSCLVNCLLEANWLSKAKGTIQHSRLLSCCSSTLPGEWNCLPSTVASTVLWSRLFKQWAGS